MLSVEEKANQKLLKTFKTSLVVCIDENNLVHFDFGAKRDCDMSPEVLAYLVSITILYLMKYGERCGITEEEVWEVLHDGTDKAKEIFQ